ncbi:MAG: DUF2953 domain-containing protein [Clostridia bacterium]|nr:DUF2953 domain-containing protein [Clostridia bacterium]
MWVLLSILVLLLLVLLIRIKVELTYDCDGFRGKFKISFYKLRFPSEKKESKPKAKTSTEQKKKGVPIGEVKDLIGLCLEVFGKTVKCIRIDKLCADVKIASDNAFKTAMLFGSSAAVCGIILPPLENNFTIRKKEINVDVDYEAKEILVVLSVGVSIAIWQLIYPGYIFIKKYMEIKNKQEGKI